MSASLNQSQMEIECAKCDCCALMEECTPGYIAKIRERYNGRWICGLCAEAVMDEMSRSKRRISTEEALDRHMTFSKSFRSLPDPPPLAHSTEELIAAMTQLLRRSLDSPRSAKGGGDGGHPPLARSKSCFPTIAG